MKITMEKLMMLLNIKEMLMHNDEYTKYEIANASGNSKYFYRLPNMMKFLLSKGAFEVSHNSEAKFTFNDDKMDKLINELPVFKRYARAVYECKVEKLGEVR